jgi:fibronectin type 3 domain-containing protein
MPGFRVTRAWPLALLVLALVFPLGATAFTGAPFEPPDGSIYSGAGQSIEAIVQMTNTGDPNRKPMLVAAYDFLNPTSIADVNVYVPQGDILTAHNLYPGSKLQIGLELPKDNLTELTAVGTGKYDNWIRGMADSYKALNQDIFLRLGYEFDGAWNKYDPTAYVAAYRRIVDIFRSEGVTNVAFVWNSYTPDQDSTDPTKTGYRWNGHLMFDWYPGDSYVDWFSFDEWKKGFDATWYMAQAAIHNKPVLIGEASYTQHLDSGYTWDQWLPAYFTSVKNSGVKGFQYINWNWPIYPITDWANWSSGKFTNNPTYVSLYNTELQNTKYIVRDSTYYNPMAFWVSASRNAASTVNGAAWSKSLDEYSAQAGYDYSVPGGLSYYGDGWGTYWANAAGTSQQVVNVTVPSGSSGYVVLGGFASYLGFDVYAGARKVLAGITATAPVKFKYQASDLAGTTLAVKIVEPDTSSIHITSVGIQTISASAPAAPTGLALSSVTPSSVSLTWQPVANAMLYNVYRNGQLIGTSTTNTFTNTNVGFGRTYQYTVSAWQDHNGEGDMSAAVTATTQGTQVDNLDDFRLTDFHSAGILLDSTNPVNFNGDTSRVTRNVRTDEYITYRVDGISSVSFDLYETNNKNNVYANVAASTSGPWTNVTLSQSAPVATANSWFKITYSGTVPTGMNVVGIHLIGGTSTTANQQQIGSVTIANTAPAGGDTQPPTAPALNLNTISSSQINASWTQASDNVGVTGYRVYRSTVSGFTPGTANLIATVGGSTLTYADTGLAAFTTYYYRVAAFDAAGNSTLSNQANTRTAH